MVALFVMCADTHCASREKEMCEAQMRPERERIVSRIGQSSEFALSLRSIYNFFSAENRGNEPPESQNVRCAGLSSLCEVAFAHGPAKTSAEF